MRKARWMFALLALGGSILTLQAPAIAAAVDSGEIVSGSLNYDHVSGVVNGNVLCSNTVDVTDDGNVVRHTLVGIDGMEKFSYTFVDRMGEEMQPQICDYMPKRSHSVSQLDHAFPAANGGLILIDNANSKRLLVNPSGDISVSGVDDLTYLNDSAYAVSVEIVSSGVKIRLHRSSDGSVLDQKVGLRGATKIYSLDSGIDYEGDELYKDGAFLSTDIGSYNICVEDESIRIMPSPEWDPSILANYDGHYVTFKNSRLTFRQADGSDKTIDGFFSDASAFNGVVTATRDGGKYYFSMTGDPIMEGWQFARVDAIGDTGRFFCQDLNGNANGDGAGYLICDSRSVVARLGKKTANSYKYVVGDYVIEAKEGSASSDGTMRMSYAVKAFDSLGDTVQTWSLSDAVTVNEFYWLGKSDVPRDCAAYWCSSEASNSSVFYDKSFNPLAELNVTFCALPKEFFVDGELGYSFGKCGSDAYGDSTSPLYDYRIQPMMIGNMQRIRAGRVAERDNINYVTDGRGHAGAVDDEGNVIIPLEYESIYDAGSNADASHILVKKNGTWHVMWLEGNGMISVDVPVVADLTFNGKNQVPVVAESDLYRVVSNDGGTNAGSYSVELELVDPGSACWADGSVGNKVISYKIAPRALTDGVKAGSIDDQTFTGAAVNPKVTLRLDGELLVEGTDYTLTHASNTKPGTGYAICQGKGNYTGELRIAFNIVKPLSFSDVDGSTPHAAHINWLASAGISKGWNNGDGTFSFRPYAIVARADMAAFLYRLAGEPSFDEGAAPSFSDVDAGTPHRRAILWLASKGISKGWANGDGTYSFRPYANVARADMAAFLYRLAGEPTFNEAEAPGFSDVNDQTPHKRAILWLATSGVSKGWNNGNGTFSFRPYVEVARCDMSAFLHRMEENGLVQK